LRDVPFSQNINSAHVMQALALIAVLSVVLQSFALREIAQEESVTLPAFTTDVATDSTIGETSKLFLQGLESFSDDTRSPWPSHPRRYVVLQEHSH
jgi:hypothetical protein